MKNTELRIGNKVDLYGTIATVQKADFSTGLAVTKGKPIPLTEEWLVKLGFEKDNTFMSKEHPFAEYVKEGVIINLPYLNFVFNETESDIQIKSVHQLQNLYFALTSEELQIKGS